MGRLYKPPGLSAKEKDTTFSRSLKGTDITLSLRSRPWNWVTGECSQLRSFRYFQQLIPLDRAQCSLSVILCSIATVQLQGVTWAGVSNLPCAISRQVVTDNHYITYSGNLRSAGEEGLKKGKGRGGSHHLL